MQGTYLFFLCVILTVSSTLCNAQVCSGCYDTYNGVGFTCADCDINVNNGVCTCGDGSPCQKCQPPPKGILFYSYIYESYLLSIKIELLGDFPCQQEYQVCGSSGTCCQASYSSPNTYQCTTNDKKQYSLSSLSNTTSNASQNCLYGQITLCTGGQCATTCVLFVPNQGAAKWQAWWALSHYNVCPCNQPWEDVMTITCY